MKYFTDRAIILKLVCILVLIGFIYMPNFKWLVHVWGKDPNFSFGYFIPIVSAYLMYYRFYQIKEIPLDDNGLRTGLIIIISSVIFFVIAHLLSIRSLSTYSMISLLMGVSYMFLGVGISRVLRFPILLLLTMIPVSDILINPISVKMKFLASFSAAKLIQLMNIPVFLDGVTLHLSSSTLEVVDACSGLRSLMSLMILGVLLGYLKHNSIVKKILLFLMTIPVAVVANIIRILALCLMSETYHINVSKNQLVHDGSGIVVFLVGLVLLTTLNNLVLEKLHFKR